MGGRRGRRRRDVITNFQAGPILDNRILATLVSCGLERILFQKQAIIRRAAQPSLDHCSDIGRTKTRTVRRKRADHCGRETIPKVVPGHARLSPGRGDDVRSNGLTTVGNQVNVKARRVNNRFSWNHTKIKPEETTFLTTSNEPCVKGRGSATVRIWIG